MFDKRGQTTVEVTIFLAILSIIFIVVFFSANNLLGSSQKQVSTYVTKDSLADLSYAAKRVYAQGNNSLELVRIQVPDFTTRSIINGTLIGFVVEKQAINSLPFLMDVEVPVGGSLPDTSGTYDINVTSNGSTVLFSYAS